MRREGDSSDEIDEEAAQWVVRQLDRTRWTPQDEKELQRWLAESRRNRAAYAATQEAFALMDLPDAFDADEVERVLGEDNSLQCRRRTLRPRFWFSAAAAAVVFVLAFFFFASPPEEARIQLVATELGELRQVTLPDGTEVSMDSRTWISYLFSNDKRLVELLSGAAVFKVGPDPLRPLEVRSGAFSIRDIGTTFSVRRLERLGSSEAANTTVEVAVEEGIVDMGPLAHNGRALNRSVRLTAGESVTWEDPETLASPERFNVDTFASWREHRLRYRNRPLGEVLADLQRHQGGEIELQEGLAELRVTGTLSSDDLTSAIAALEAILPIKITRVRAGLIVAGDD